MVESGVGKQKKFRPWVYKLIVNHVKVALGQDFAKPGFGCAIEFYISMTSSRLPCVPRLDKQ